MKPSTRFLVSGMTWVLVSVGLAAAGVIWQTHRTGQTRALARQQTAATVEADLQATRFTVLQLRASVLANDPAFVDYVAHALIPNPTLGGAIDSVSIGDLLNQRRKGYDVAMVLDSQGHPAATSGVLLKDAASIAREALVTKCIATGKPTHGMWVSHGRLLWVTVNPLLRGGSLRGLLLAATRVDDAFTIAIARITGTDIAIVANGSDASLAAHSSGLDIWETNALESDTQTLLDIQDAHGAALTLADAGQTVAAWVTPLPGSHGHAVLVTMEANAGTSSWIEPVAWPLLAGIAILGLLAAGLVILHWRRTCLPMNHISEVIQQAASGDQFMHARGGGSALARQVGDAVNRLLQRYRV